MRLLDRFRSGVLKLARIEAFSDGVFAIIVTLLVLELKVPAIADHRDVGALAAQLIDLVPKFLSWMISFIIVCKFWVNHHHTLGLARHADFALLWLNALFLMFQSFVPFPTALMGEYPRNPLAVSGFGVVMAFNTLLFAALSGYIRGHLLRPDAAAQVDPHALRHTLIGVAGYAIGVAGAWVSVYIAFAAYALTPLYYIVPRTRSAAQPCGPASS